MAFGQPNPAFLANMSGFLSGMSAQQPMAPQAPVSPPMAQAAQPPVAPIAQAVQSQQHHGINWLGVLADALSGAAGQPGMYAQSMMRQKDHQQNLDDYNRKRMDENSDWQSHYQYEVDHPKPHEPAETERMMNEYLDPNTPPDRKALIGQQLIKPQAITVTNPDGSQEMRFIYPGQQAPQGPRVFKQLPPDAVPVNGGPTPSASGTFR